MSHGSPTRKLILIDGNGLAYRSFYAVPPQKTRAGLPTNALLGFTNLLLNVLLNEKPTHLVVAFDQGAPTERIQKFQAYNAQREEMPEELAVQVPLVEDLVRIAGLAACRVRGHEADDCIGTLVARARQDGFQVLIVSGDLDLLQLVGPGVRVLTTRRGIGDLVVYDEELVRKRYNLDACQLADLRALAGDSSQNISGVPGIGEVTARKLLSQYRSLEDLLGSLDQLPAKWRNPLSENREEALEFLHRATIATTLEIPLDWEQCAVAGVRTGPLGRLLGRLEMSADLEHLTKRLERLALPVAEPAEPRSLAGEEARQALREVAEGGGPLALHPVLRGGQELGLGLAWGEEAVYLAFGEGALGAAEAWSLLAPALEDAGRPTYLHGLQGAPGLPVGPRLRAARGLVDLQAASSLLDPGDREHHLEALARRHGRVVASESELWGLEAQVEGAELPEGLAGWAADRARSILGLGVEVEERLREGGLEGRFQRVEMNLARLGSEVEERGLALEPEAVEALAEAVEEALEALRQEVFAEADEPFDLDCDRQLGELLFDRLGLLVPSRPKNGGPIANEVLASLASQHPVAGSVRSYRELTEFKAAFVEGFLRARRGDAELGGSLFNPALTAETRLRWMGPLAVPGAWSSWQRMMAVVDNLQTLPVRSSLRLGLESALSPEGEGQTFLSLRLDQPELRLLAHLSGDPVLAAALDREGEVEAWLAAELYEVPLEEVTAPMRETAVDVLLFRMGPRWLSRRLDLEEEAARQAAARLRAAFGQRFPVAEGWFEGRMGECRQRGSLTTLGGRRRTVPELWSRNFDIRERGERLARAGALEGSLADLLMGATACLVAAQREGRLPGRVALHLGSTLLLEVPEEQAARAAALCEGVLAEELPAWLRGRLRLAVGPRVHRLRSLEPEVAAL